MTNVEPKDDDVVIWHLEQEEKPLQAYMVKGGGQPPRRLEGRIAWKEAYAEAERRASPNAEIWSRHFDGTFTKWPKR